MAKKTQNPSETESQDLIRTFICIELPESIKQKMELLENQLRGVDAQVSWVRPSNVHLTLKFLGGVPQHKIDRVTEALKRASRDTAPFEVQIAGANREIRIIDREKQEWKQ